ncbi:MAG TPA: ABC transporter substrate-binding protein [Nevskiaceae bacterium]
MSARAASAAASVPAWPSDASLAVPFIQSTSRTALSLNFRNKRDSIRSRPARYETGDRHDGGGREMRNMFRVAATAIASGLLLGVSVTAFAAQPVKIGFLTTLSTGAGYLGQDALNGFKLAMAEDGGKLGGVPVTLVVADDGLNPGKARQIVTRMIEADHVELMTGSIFSNVAMATAPEVVDHNMVYISPNAGPSELAGRMCSENYFNVAWSNDNQAEAMGKYLTDKGYKTAYLLAPNYQSGKDQLTGFKRFYKGKVVGEDFTPLGQTDYSAAIAAIRAAKPDAVFFFYPGGMGISFVKQFAEAGLIGKIPMFGPAFSFDNTQIVAMGKAALGAMNASQWSVDFKNPANERFVAGYEKAYHEVPTLYSSQGYDDARLIGSALKAVHGDVHNIAAFRKALMAANFHSVRGSFKFASDHFPIQNFYLRKVVEGPDGKPVNHVVEEIMKNRSNAYLGECHMK